MIRGLYSDIRIRRENKRTNVQGRALRVRNPILFHLNELFQRTENKFLVDLRNYHSFRGNVHSLEVLVGAEHLNSAVRRAVCLQALEYLLTVVQAHSGGGQRDLAVGYYTRVMPALSRVVVHNEHMIGKNVTEAELGLVGGLCLRRCCLLDLDFHFKLPSFEAGG